VDGGEEAGAQVVVEVLVLAHLKHLLPLLHRHLALDALGRLLLLAEFLPTELQARSNTHPYVNKLQERSNTHPCVNKLQGRSNTHPYVNKLQARSNTHPYVNKLQARSNTHPYVNKLQARSNTHPHVNKLQVSEAQFCGGILVNDK